MKRTPFVLSVACAVVVFAAMSLAVAGDAQTITIKVSPSMLVLHAKGGTVSVHADITYSLVDRSSVEMNGLKPYLLKADDRGDLVAKFHTDEVKAIVSPPSATMTFTGRTTSGEAFEGTDEIGVK